MRVCFFCLLASGITQNVISGFSRDLGNKTRTRTREEFTFGSDAKHILIIFYRSHIYDIQITDDHYQNFVRVAYRCGSVLLRRGVEIQTGRAILGVFPINNAL